MSKLRVPQPDFPDIVHFKGSPEAGFVEATFVARVNKNGSVTYEMDTKGEVELTADESTKIAAVMQKFATKKGVAVDVALKEAVADEVPAGK
jgi:hypothetical protein